MLAMLADSGDLRILPHTDELILATIAFGILVVFLLKAVFPRLKKALEDRTAKIQGQLEEAEEAQEIVRRAQADVAGERDRAIQQLQTTLGELSIELAARIIEQDLRNNEAARQLVDKAIQDLAQTPSGQA
ncbi:MAG: hypothetical protein E6G04_12920 [Actinobacteria bacterium]|nr:MAG: hypothetical protein E6G04_12920 [Actinomycetota bacterium]